MPENTEVIVQNYAFNNCVKLFNDLTQEDVDQFCKSIKAIGNLAFLAVPFGGLTLNLSHNLTRIGSNGFAETGMEAVNIGSVGHASAFMSPGTNMFGDSSVSKITIYTDDISKSVWNTFKNNVGNGAEVQILSA